MTVKAFIILRRVPRDRRVAAAGPRSRRSPPRRQPTRLSPTPHKEDANIVEVDEGMLRDLRITTRAVESRAGGELVMLLGELAVDERTYAEVGTPAAARVTRLLVNAGDTVRRGQTLAELTSPELGRARAEYLSAQRASDAGRRRARAQARPGRRKDCAAAGGAGGGVGGRRSTRCASRRRAPRLPPSASSRRRH